MEEPERMPEPSPSVPLLPSDDAPELAAFAGRRDAEAVRDTFALAPGERVRAMVGPDDDDFRWNFLGLWAVLAVPAIVGVIAGETGVVGALVWSALAGIIGATAGGISSMGAPSVLATDRGLRVLGRRRRPILIPWDDLLEIESTVPFAAEYRILLREGAPALEALKRSSWTSRKGPENSRVIGSNAVWDVNEKGLDALRDVFDQQLVGRFATELREERASLAKPTDTTDDYANDSEAETR